MNAGIRVLSLVLAVAGCGHVAAPTIGPVALPPPDEARRVAHPAGYSIVFPEGCQAQVDPPVYQGDSTTKDALATVRPKDAYGSDEFGTPTLTVRRFSKEHVARNGGKPVPTYFRPTQFQNQPAFAHFDAGYGPGSERAGTTTATRGGYSPNLDQELIFERDGSWFHVSFSMRNLAGREPRYREPLQVVQDYFESFRYAPAPTADQLDTK